MSTDHETNTTDTQNRFTNGDADGARAWLTDPPARTKTSHPDDYYQVAHRPPTPTDELPDRPRPCDDAQVKRKAVPLPEGGGPVVFAMEDTARGAGDAVITAEGDDWCALDAWR